MQAIRAAQKSDPDLLIDDDHASTESESTVTTISPSRPPMESQVIAKSDRPDNDDDTQPSALAPFVESLGSVRINTPMFATPIQPIVLVDDHSTAFVKVSRVEPAESANDLTPLPASRVRPILFGITALMLIALAVFLAIRH